jgi:hypothetical protein
MRTTISIDGDLLKKARGYALRKHRSLSALIEDALREVLARRTDGAPRASRQRLPVVKGKAIPGIDYDSFASLMELTESK